ncbi:hypothetical protein KEM56_006735 [Ascosphaera pollenicola]|nr:hypothetical protein KEM56_006735 [Ascosphaera pollenicola]
MGGRRFKPSLFKLPSPPSSACHEEDYVMVDAVLWLEKDTDIAMSDVSSDSEDDSSDPLAQATSWWQTFYVPPPFGKRSETESDTKKAAPAGSDHPLLSEKAAWDYLRPKKGVEAVMEWYLRNRDKPLEMLDLD